ncbi:hypothetical protein RXV95_12430 [Novosphingobium sp. ZN18A2]|uniref:hypothetical protein n=1 Tax=Novosphingobium sp. ZN18A2 TaxID=3079861 RepID=UPI0030CA9339
MLAIAISLVFTISAAFAVLSIVATFRSHGAKAIELVRLSRTMTDKRDFVVSWWDYPAAGDVVQALPRSRQPARGGVTRRPAPALPGAPQRAAA